jgi:AraC-like DNA-binding protein/quercetin dioxygenase-like cupin family protein
MLRLQLAATSAKRHYKRGAMYRRKTEFDVAIGRFIMAPTGLSGVRSVLAESRHHFPRHSHEEYGIGLILDGAQRSLSGRGMVEASAGDIITVNPGEVHDGMPIADRARTWRMLYLDPSVVMALVSEIRESGTGHFEFHHPVLHDRRTRERLAALLAATDPASAQGLDEEALLLLIADLAGIREAADIGNRRLDQARARIDDDPVRAASLTELAQICGLSRFQFLRAFARETGLTPHAYLLQRRIDMARRLMAGGLPIASAAVDAGFSDQSHLTRHFVARYGISPGAFQRAAAPRLQ